MEDFIREGNVIEDRYGKIWYEDGIMYASYKKGVVVTEEVARLRKKYRLILSGGEKVVAFVYTEGVQYWTQGSKKYSNSPEGLSDLIAVAILHDNAIFRIIFEAGMRLFPPSIPIKTFSHEEKAKQWLKSVLHL